MFLLKPKFVITLAILTGLLAAYGVYHFLKQQEARTTDSALPTFVSQRVVVSVTDLPVGSQLTPLDMQIRMWPENLIPAGSCDSLEKLVGRVLKIEIAAGEPVLESKLAPDGSTGGFSSLIPPGMRAVTVGVNVVSGVGGFILPRTRVDVLVTVTGVGSSGDRSTKTILQNVEVLAVDQTYDQDSDDPVTVKSVTLLVTPEEAEQVALAANEGVLQLAIRSGADDELFIGRGIELKQLMKSYTPPQPRVVSSSRPKPEPPPPPPPEPGTKVVEIIRANRLSEVEFEEMPAESSNASK
ncbi:MAG: Flp pilus assembly protein CpaB [Candidatus Eisenbacteria bacterium]